MTITFELIQWSHQQADRFDLPTGGHNDQRDAFRHALISAELTRLVGPVISKILMDSHEKNNPNLPNEANMDYWNMD